MFNSAVVSIFFLINCSFFSRLIAQFCTSNLILYHFNCTLSNADFSSKLCTPFPIAKMWNLLCDLKTHCVLLRYAFGKCHSCPLMVFVLLSQVLDKLHFFAIITSSLKKSVLACSVNKFLRIFSNFCIMNLLLLRSHQAEIMIVKRLI